MRLVKFWFATTKITISKNVKIIKSADKELARLKKDLALKQPLTAANLYEQFHHKEIYQRIDTDIESFFFKRPYNLQNFNFLVNLLGEQRKPEKIPEVLQKMQKLSIKPDERTYNYLLRNEALQGNISRSEEVFKTACELFGASKYLYTSLMQAYVRTNDPEMAYKIVKEMQERGIEPDLPVYTTLINSFRIGRKIQRCWEIDKSILRKHMELDETYVGVMLKVNAATHDAERAVKLYREQIIEKHVTPMLETTNAYLKALSTRAEYSKKAIDLFYELVEKGKAINQETVSWALKAASAGANVTSAVQIVKIMKMRKIQPSARIYNSLLRVYGQAINVPMLSTRYKELILMDSWKLIQDIANKNLVSTTILNNLLYIYASALDDSKVEGFILPMYTKHGLKFNPYTYQILVDMSYKKKDLTAALRVWQQMKKSLEEKKKAFAQAKSPELLVMERRNEEFRPTFKLCEQYLQIAIRLMDRKMVLEALDNFKEMKRPPKNSTLKFLGNLKNLPIQIQSSLMDFDIRFGAAKIAKVRTHSQKFVNDPQNY